MSTIRKNPITRLEKFFGEQDFQLEVEMGREWLNGDLNVRLVLYSVDQERTIKDDVYGEVVSDGIQYKPPVEFRAYVNIAEANNNFMGSSRIIQNEPGNMTFSVYHKELEELNVNIQLGDYIGYWITESEMRFYSVVDAATPDYDNKHTYEGYKSFYYSYTATPVSANEFTGF